MEKISSGKAFHGFDARTREFVDLDERGIIDPTKVVRLALEHAVKVDDSHAGALPTSLDFGLTC